MADFFQILLLQPLMVIYQVLFDLPVWLGQGEKIIVFSILLNFLLFPLYRQMEASSRQGRRLREQMTREVARMKANFKGRERYFYIRAVHRQYRYHPIQALFTSNELFLQIFIFATVFHFLSGPGLLDGATFGRVEDLGRPDKLLDGINLLPLLMTVINAISVLYYVNDKGQRLQAMALALVFLALLYASPAGLVLYWTINNLWSLLRNMLSRRHLNEIAS